jgi:hypothetical protein
MMPRFFCLSLQHIFNNSMEKLFIISFIFSVYACAGPNKNDIALPDGLVGLSSSSQLACRYEKQVLEGNKEQKSNWYFWRQEHRTETRDAFSNQGEIWEVIKPGEIYYTRLFYNEHVALEWGHGDLMASGSTPVIKQISSIVDPDMLGKELVLQSKAESNGMFIESYRGTLNKIATEVDWLPTLKLPARLKKMLPEGTVTLTLTACGKQSQFSAKPITKAEFDDFRRLDFTDLGDMEDDPMVQHVEQLMGGRNHNSH